MLSRSGQSTTHGRYGHTYIYIHFFPYRPRTKYSRQYLPQLQFYKWLYTVVIQLLYSNSIVVLLFLQARVYIYSMGFFLKRSSHVPQILTSPKTILLIYIYVQFPYYYFTLSKKLVHFSSVSSFIIISLNSKLKKIVF